MVETGSPSSSSNSNGGTNEDIEDANNCLVGLDDTDASLAKNAKKKTEIVRLIIQSLQSLGYGYVMHSISTKRMKESEIK